MNELIVPFLMSSIICLAWLKFCQTLSNQKLLSKEVSRKLIHIGTGVLFVLTWQLYPQFNWWSRIVSGLIPLLISFHFTLIAIGFIHDQKTVESMSRTGSPRELLFGPLSYGIIISLLSMLYWFDSPISIITIGILCFGDGFAAIFGTKYGKTKLPYNKEKTYIGTLAFYICSFIGTFVLLTLSQNRLFMPSLVYVKSLLITCTLSAIIESLPVTSVWDNFNVSLTSIVTLSLLGY